MSFSLKRSSHKLVLIATILSTVGDCTSLPVQYYEANGLKIVTVYTHGLYKSHVLQLNLVCCYVLKWFGTIIIKLYSHYSNTIICRTWCTLYQIQAFIMQTWTKYNIMGYHCTQPQINIPVTAAHCPIIIQDTKLYSRTFSRK